MFARIARAVFGTANDRSLKGYQKRLPEINALEPSIKALDDNALRAKTEEFKGRIAGGESLDKIMPEAFAVCREASRRVLGMRHFDVQLVGGMVLHSGRIAEMRTGEGKTLVATLAVYLSALAQGRACGHGERLSGQARRRGNEQALQFSRPDDRCDHSKPVR